MSTTGRAPFTVAVIQDGVESTAAATLGSSVATSTRSTPRASLARRHTCAIIGLPAISASALPGSRVEAYRAGMITTTDTRRRRPF